MPVMIRRAGEVRVKKLFRSLRMRYHHETCNMVHGVGDFRLLLEGKLLWSPNSRCPWEDCSVKCPKACSVICDYCYCSRTGGPIPFHFGGLDFQYLSPVKYEIIGTPVTRLLVFIWTTQKPVGWLVNLANQQALAEIGFSFRQIHKTCIQASGPIPQILQLGSAS